MTNWLYFFIFLLENRIWHFMQIVHELLDNIFLGKIRKIFQNVCWNFFPAYKELTFLQQPPFYKRTEKALVRVSICTVWFCRTHLILPFVLLTVKSQASLSIFYWPVSFLFSWAIYMYQKEPSRICTEYQRSKPACINNLCRLTLVFVIHILENKFG